MGVELGEHACRAVTAAGEPEQVEAEEPAHEDHHGQNERYEISDGAPGGDALLTGLPGRGKGVDDAVWKLGADLPLVAGGERTAGKLDGLAVEDATTAGLGAIEVGLGLELGGANGGRQGDDDAGGRDGVAPAGLDKRPEVLVAAGVDAERADQGVFEAERARAIGGRIEMPGDLALARVVLDREGAWRSARAFVEALAVLADLLADDVVQTCKRDGAEGELERPTNKPDLPGLDDMDLAVLPDGNLAVTPFDDNFFFLGRYGGSQCHKGEQQTNETAEMEQMTPHWVRPSCKASRR